MQQDKDPKNIPIADYDYQLPDDRIALRPLAQRDASKLLIYKNGAISEVAFSQITEYIPQGTLAIFNNTKVIHARIMFEKLNGAPIEIFCLEPAGNITEYVSVMNANGSAKWRCFVGGAAKWKDQTLQKKIKIGIEEIILTAAKTEKENETYIINLSWEPATYTFSEISEAAGVVPLPPYIKRAAEETDDSRYQTVFAMHQGSVAAPTAGLHFTPEILEKFSKKNIQVSNVTLHVGAGTFKPVKAETMAGHEMHAEYMDVSISTLKQIINNLGNIAAVGTTSLRTLESLYWLGVKAYGNKHADEFSLLQWEAYDQKLSTNDLTPKAALEALLEWAVLKSKKSIFTRTRILIVPGYRFRIVNMLVTNFHQPRSTLLLLIAAAIGEDWKNMYSYALEHNFRFLSYGDANLLFINN